MAIADYMLPGLGGHLYRVGDKAGQVAIALNLPEHKQIRRAGFYHDIGKLSWPQRLRQGQPYNDDDYKIIYNHPVVGAEMLAAYVELADLSLLIRHHHERFDGAGLPDGLAGTEIPLGARIISVCDVADAITMERNYDPARPHEEMIDIIQSVAGSQLDPEIVAIYVDLFRNEEKAN